MGSLNKVMLIGRLGKDPETRSYENGEMTAFTLATTERYSSGGEQQEKTEWHNIVCFNKISDIASKYLSKGSMVYIEGKLQTKKKDDKYYTSIIANNIQFLDSKSSNKDAVKQATTTNQDLPQEDDLPF